MAQHTKLPTLSSYTEITALTRTTQAFLPPNTTTAPYADVKVRGCPAEIEKISIRAYNEKGQFLDYFTPSPNEGGQEDEFRASIPNLSRSAEVLEDFVGHVVDYFLGAENTELFIADDIDTDTLVDLAEDIVRDGISAETSKLEELDDLAGWQHPGTVNLDGLGNQIKRSALRGLGVALQLARGVGRVGNILPLAEAVQSASDFAMAVTFDQVSFDVSVTTKSGERTISTRTDLQPVDRIFPTLFATVPCESIDIKASYQLEQFYDEGFCSDSLFNNRYRVPLDVVVSPSQEVTINVDVESLSPESPNRDIGLVFNSNLGSLVQSVDDGKIVLSNSGTNLAIVSGLTIVTTSIEPKVIDLGSVVQSIPLSHNGAWINYDVEFPEWMGFSCTNVNEYSLENASLSILPNSSVFFNATTSGIVTSGGDQVGCFDWEFPAFSREYSLAGSCSDVSFTSPGVSTISVQSSFENGSVSVNFSEKYDFSNTNSSDCCELEGRQTFDFGTTFQSGITQ